MGLTVSLIVFCIFHVFNFLKKFTNLLTKLLHRDSVIADSSLELQGLGLPQGFKDFCCLQLQGLCPVQANIVGSGVFRP